MITFLMMTSSNETLSASLALCAGNSTVTGEFPSQRPVTRSFDVFFDLRLNKRLSKQSWDWWFGTPSRSLWRHCNVLLKITQVYNSITHQSIHCNRFEYPIPSMHSIRMRGYQDSTSDFGRKATNPIDCTHLSVVNSETVIDEPYAWHEWDCPDEKTVFLEQKFVSAL